MKESHTLRQAQDDIRRLVQIIAIALFLLPFGKAGMGYAQTYVAIPDSNFVHYLKSIIPTAMSGDQLNTSSTLVTTTTHSINVANSSIASLSGVQYFTSLTYLNCDSNSLPSLPVLPNSIQFLRCSNNYMDTLPALPTSLQVLYCSSNYLSKLPALPASLVNIACYTNYITTLPALPNALTQLVCSGNSLTSLPTLPISINALYCDNNSLASLPALPNSLQTLFCNDNFLTTLPTLPNALQTLQCGNNNIACFPTFPNSITTVNIDPNPFYCLPNYISGMSTTDLGTSLCANSNPGNCYYAGINELKVLGDELKVYPNPAKDILNVEGLLVNENSSIAITDMLGKEVLNRSLTPALSKGEGVTIDVSSLSEGVYNLSISTTEGVVNKRVVIER